MAAGYNGLPSLIKAASGVLPRRDASPEEASVALAWEEAPWPTVAGEAVAASPYREAFRNGATIFPRALCAVEEAPAGVLGPNPVAPVVQSRRTSQEKRPWKDLPTADAHKLGIALLRGNVEQEFLRPLYVGESVAPFRLLNPVLSVIPWERSARRLLDSAAALRMGYAHQADWLRRAEEHWERHRRRRTTLVEQLDYYGKLTAQFPIARLRVVFTASGTLPAAAVVRDPSAIVEHGLYWLAPTTEHEARYLCAVLNTETARSLAAHLQARGQWGARHFDKVILSLYIPRYDGTVALHQELVSGAERADRVASNVRLREGMHFVIVRRRIRQALQEDGVAQRMDDLVERLIGS